MFAHIEHQPVPVRPLLHEAKGDEGIINEEAAVEPGVSQEEQ